MFAHKKQKIKTSIKLIYHHKVLQVRMKWHDLSCCIVSFTFFGWSLWLKRFHYCCTKIKPFSPGICQRWLVDKKKKNKNKHLFIVEFRKKWKKKLWKEWNEQKLLFKFIFFLFYTIFSVFQRVVFMFKCMYVWVCVFVCFFPSIYSFYIDVVMYMRYICIFCMLFVGA